MMLFKEYKEVRTRMIRAATERSLLQFVAVMTLAILISLMMMKGFDVPSTATLPETLVDMASDFAFFLLGAACAIRAALKTLEAHLFPFSMQTESEDLRIAERRETDGSWTEVLFTDLRKGDHFRLYEPGTKNPVVWMETTVFRATSKARLKKVKGSDIKQGTISCEPAE